MRKALFFLSLTALLFACSNNKVPDGIMRQPKMVAIMWDLARADEFLDAYVLSKDTLIDKASKTAEWYDQIFRLHQTKRETFEKSYRYYQEHPQLMKEVLDSLSKKPMDSALRPQPIQTGPADSAMRTDPGVKPGTNFFNIDTLKKRRKKT